MPEISYYSECDQEYVRAVKRCKSLAELQEIVTEYRELAEDSYKVVEKMDEKSFEEFCKGRNKRQPHFKWMNEYGAVLLPEKILKIGLLAGQFNVPFGTAYHRVKQMEAKKK